MVQCPDISSLMARNTDAFALTYSEIPHTSTVQTEIDTGNHSLHSWKLYRAPLASRQVIEKAVENVLRDVITSRKIYE